MRVMDTSRLRALVRPSPGSRLVIKVALDWLVFTLAIIAAYYTRFEATPVGPYRAQLLFLIPTLPLTRLAIGRLFGVYQTSWRLFGLPEAVLLLQSVAPVTGLLLVARLLMPLWPGYGVVPFGVIALEIFFTVTGTVGLRALTRIVDEHFERERVRTQTRDVPKRALLVGAGRAGRMAARELRNRPDTGYDPIGFLDDDPARANQIIEGVRVLGTTDDVVAIADRVGAEVIILTMPATSRARVRAIVERCRKTGLPVQTVPGLFELISGRVGITKIRPLRIEDLLGRDVVELDEQVWSRVQTAFADKRVMVTGAGGSIGAELCRQLADLSPASLVLFEANENNLFEIEEEIRHKIGERAIPCLGDVRDTAQVEKVFAEHRPQVVFHAAAYKHVPMMELHPAAAIINNVRGTRIVTDAADRHGVERFLLVSTDKAVNPTSIMGASKRVAEMVVHARNGTSSTRFCAVRFGNVLGSRGSVLHTFQRQIEQGGPVTVTHPEITRFFMTIPEAVRLLIQACAIGDGGETFLLDMGEPVKILDMAKQMIRLAGLSEDEVPIEIVGLRLGEKLHEELLRHGEQGEQSSVAGIMLAKAAATDRIDVATWVDRLERAGEEQDIETIRRILTTATGYAPPGDSPKPSTVSGQPSARAAL